MYFQVVQNEVKQNATHTQDYIPKFGCFQINNSAL